MDRLENWTERNFTKLNKAKCKVLLLWMITPCTNTQCGWTGWKADLKRTFWGSWWTASWPWASSVPSLQRKPTASCAALGRTLPAVWRRSSFLSTHHWCSDPDQESTTRGGVSDPYINLSRRRSVLHMQFGLQSVSYCTNPLAWGWAHPAHGNRSLQAASTWHWWSHHLSGLAFI